MNTKLFLNPKTIAIVGASRDETKVGHRLVVNAKNGHGVEVIPINPQASEIAGLRAYPSLREVKKFIDIVIIAVPVSVVEKVITECELIKPSAVVLITSGFAELGVEGARLQTVIAERLRHAGITLLGPNSMGYVYTPAQLNCSFGPANVSAGNIAIVSQSGALLSAAFQAFESANEGVSLAVSLGNKAGICEHDFISLLGDDPYTSVILLYLESITDPSRFFAECSIVAQKKPIFLLQGGTTSEGMKASASHTAALATSTSLLVSAQRQAGFVIVETLEELLRTGIAASRLRTLPQNTAVVTNAGGPSVVFVDELTRRHVPLARYSPRSLEMFHDRLPHVHPANPLDLLGDARPQDFGTATSILLADTNVDSISIIVTEQAVTDVKNIADAIASPPRHKGVFVSFPAGESMSAQRKALRAKGIFTSEYPNQIAGSLGALVHASQIQRTIRPFQPLSKTISGTFPYPQVYEDFLSILSSENFHMPKQVIVNSALNLSELESLQYPLIAKTTAMDIKHKANVGAVIAQIPNAEASSHAYASLEVWKAPVVFQEYARGMEMIVGCVKDERFGWYIAFGMGGSFTNVLADRAYVFLPANRTEFRDALLLTKIGQSFTPPVREVALNFLEKVSELAGLMKDVREFEFNPVFVTDAGCTIADMKRSR